MMYWIKKFFSDGKAHWQAFSEVVIVAAFTFALYIGSFLKNNAQHEHTMKGNFLERGEIFLLIYSLFGTLFYLAFIHVGKPSNGPKKFFGFLITLTIIPVVLLSGFDPTFRSIVNYDINFIGYVVFAFFLFSYYALLFYQELAPPDPEKVLEDGARNMANKARELNK